jgi:transposase
MPYAQDRLDAMAAISGAEYKGRVIAAKGKAGATPKLTQEQRDRARVLAADGVHLDDIADKFKVSSSTIRRAIK